MLKPPNTAARDARRGAGAQPRRVVRQASRKPQELAGSWKSNLGAVELQIIGEEVSGRYEWGPDSELGDNRPALPPERWIGEISGFRDGDYIIFRWHWPSHDGRSGYGYWRISEHELTGGWFYDSEQPGYKELTLLASGDKPPDFPENQEWQLQKD